MKEIYVLGISLFLILMSSCDIISTQMVAEDDFYINEELAIVGYLSNKGAVVNLQKTVSAFNKEAKGDSVENAIVELYNKKKQRVSNFIKTDAYNYTTPSSFVPDPDQFYYVAISAPGFDSVISAPQSIIKLNDIERIRIEIHSTNYSKDDTIPNYLFGRPRQIILTYYTPNTTDEITNQLSRSLYKYQSVMFQSNGKTIEKYKLPNFYMNLGQGVKPLTEKTDTISETFRFFDQVSLDATILYADSVYHILERMDTVLVQTFTFSEDMVCFFTRVREYMESRYDPFSIVAKEIPSNMSNGIGYFGEVFISERKIALPNIVNDTLDFTF